MKFVNGLEIDASYLLLLEETRGVGGIMLGSCLTVVRQGKGVGWVAVDQVQQWWVC